MKLKAITYLFFGLGLILALFSIPDSGALTATHIQRTTEATVASDATAVLGLDGFDGNTRNIPNNNKLNSVGTIRNNARYPISLTVDISTDFGTETGLQLDLQIGTVLKSFTTSSTESVTLSLASGESIPVSAYMSKNLGNNKSITVTYHFTAISDSVSYQVPSATGTPRTMSFR